MSCGVGRRCGLDPMLLWLWCRPVATAPIQPLAWEPAYAAGAAQEMAKKRQQQQKVYKQLSAGEGVGEKGTLLHCWCECKLVQPLWKTVWRFLRKLKIELPSDSVIPLLGIYPKKTMTQKAHLKKTTKKVHVPQCS